MRFFLDVVPTAKGRPRLGKGKTFTPAKTRRSAKAYALLLGPHTPTAPLDGPLYLEAEFVMALPKGYKRSLHGAPHPKRPDLDNLLKQLLDCMGADWFKDDSQVARVLSCKRYQRKGEQTGIWVELQALMP